jgi:hypothetical protein
MMQRLLLLSLFAVLMVTPSLAQQATAGLPAGTPAPSLQAFTSDMEMPAATAAGTTVPLFYHNPNSTSVFNWQVPRDYGAFVNLYMLQRFTLPGNAGFLDSVAVYIQAIDKGAIRLRVYPDSIYDLGTASFRFPTFWNLLDDVQLDISQMRVPGWNTVKLNGAIVPKQFFVSVEFTISGGSNNTLLLRGDSHQKPRRSLDDSRVVLLNQQPGGDLTVTLLDSLLVESSSQARIYSNLFMVAFADTAASSPLPKFTSTSKKTAFVGQPYGYQAQASGVPRPVYSIVTGPNGMTINQTTGVITWTPDAGQVGSHQVTLRATNSNGQAEQSYSVTVANATAPKITSYPNRTAIVSEPYFYTVTATGGPEPTFRLFGNPPAGMVIDPVTGQITFTPTMGQVGTFIISVDAVNALGTDRQSFGLTVDATQKAPAIVSTAKTTATVGVEYSYEVSANGNPMPTFSLPTAPSGMTINAQSGMIIWTPTTAGSFDVTVRATNRVSSADQNFTIVAQNAGEAPVFTSTPVQVVVAGQVYQYKAVATGTPAPTYSLKLAPDGMQVDPTSGVITWSPSRSDKGQYSITITATNAVASVDQTFSLTVQAAPRITSEPQYGGKLGELYSYQVQVDAEPTATVTLAQAPTGMTVSPTGLVQWTPAAGQLGQHRVRVEATNSVGSDQQEFTIDVLDPTSVESIARLRGFTLSQNYPNPVSLQASAPVSLEMTLPAAMHARVELRDLLGRMVVVISDARHAAGTHVLSFVPASIQSIAPGTYLVQMQAADITLVRPITIMR